MQRIVLFLCTNLAIMLVLGLVVNLLGVNRFLTSKGLDLGMLLTFAAIMGFGGSFISLFMSKTIAKWSTGARVIEHPQAATEQWLVNTVARLAQRANLAKPEVAIYDGEPNAFAGLPQNWHPPESPLAGAGRSSLPPIPAWKSGSPPCKPDTLFRINWEQIRFARHCISRSLKRRL